MPESNNLKIVFALSAFSSDIGGPVVYARNLAKHLKESSIETEIVSYAGLKKIPKGLRHFLFFWRLSRACFGADIVYSFNLTSCGLPACLVAWLLRKKFVVRVGGDFLWERAVEKGRSQEPLREYYNNRQTGQLSFGLGEKFWLYVQKQALKQADKVIFTSNFQKEIYENLFGQLTFYARAQKVNSNKEEKVVVIENPFIRISNFQFPPKESPCDPTGQAISSEFPISNFQLLYAGRLAKCKNIDMLVKVFNRVIEQTNTPLTLKIVGKKPISHQELLKEIERSWLCVLPSLTEVSPNFALECIALRKPILLTKENGLPSRIKEKLILIDPKNSTDLENKILYLLNQENYQKYLAQIKSIDTAYSWLQVAEQHILLFNKLL